MKQSLDMQIKNKKPQKEQAEFGTNSAEELHPFSFRELTSPTVTQSYWASKFCTVKKHKAPKHDLQGMKMPQIT